MSGKQKVLIVDDEPKNLRIIAEILEEYLDYETAANGEEALTKVESFLPDLILLDIMMPGIDGYEVCKRIRESDHFKSVKIILVSGKAMIEERLKGYEVGADDYMTKPFEHEELLAKTKVYLRLTMFEKQLHELNASLDRMVQERTEQLIKAEAKLVTAAKMSALGEMAGGIAHEINTPLGTIGMVAEQIEEMVNEDKIDRQTINEMTKIIGGTVQRISTIISGLRTFSRDANQDQFDSVPVKQIIENTLTLCSEKFKHENVNLILDPIGDDVRVQCRSVQISQVLLNLLGNACDAIQWDKGKWIRISVEKAGKEILIKITDSGKGIPEAVRDKLFQPFFTTKEVGKGTGLGLSIAKGIMDAHQGVLEVNPDCENTQFVLRFPETAIPKRVA